MSLPVRYINCDNNYESLLSLIKQTIVADDSGNWYIRVVAVDPEDMPVSLLTNIQCGQDWHNLEEIKRLLVYDNDGNLAFAVYNST